MRFLIAGGNGFIGANLCRRLLNEGHEILVIDDNSTSNPDNLREVLCHSKMMFKKGDIRDTRFVMDYAGYQLDYVINLACPASPIHYQKTPIKTLETNFVGTKNLLDLAKKHNSRFLQASTSEIYGDPLQHPQSESYWGNVNTIGPRSCYDEGKRVAESLVHEYQKAGLDTRLIRIFNTYGPYMAVDDGRVVSNFICQALQNKDITLYGAGCQTRSFQYIDDLLDGMLFVLAANHYYEPVNIGNPREFTILELAQKVIGQIPETTSRMIYEPLPVDDPRQRCPDITNMRKHFGWEPKIQLAEGLTKTIEYFRGKLG